MNEEDFIEKVILYIVIACLCNKNSDKKHIHGNILSFEKNSIYKFIAYVGNLSSACIREYQQNNDTVEENRISFSKYHLEYDNSGKSIYLNMFNDFLSTNIDNINIVGVFRNGFANLTVKTNNKVLYYNFKTNIYYETN